MKIIALANRKGGVGKTTTAINLASGLALAKKGKAKVLLLEMDSQENATLTLSKRQGIEPNIYQFLLDDGVKAEDIIIPSTQENLDLMPGHDDLSGAEVDLVKEIDGRERLRNCLEKKMTNQYDYIIIDSPPSLGFLTINALSSATDVIIPVSPGLYSLQGVSKVIAKVAEVREHLRRPQLKIAGILRTFYENTIVSKDTSSLLQEHFSDLLLETIIPKNVAIDEAHSRHTSIFEYNRNSKGSIAYAKLVEEVMTRVEI